MELTIRRGDGLDDVLSRVKHQAIEETKSLTQQTNPLSEALFVYLQNIYADDLKIWYKEPFQELHSPLPVLTPKEINEFLQQTTSYRHETNYQRLTGLYVSALLQKSYDSGHNNFSLDFPNPPHLKRIGIKLFGKETNAMFLSVRGNLGLHSFFEAKYLQVKLSSSRIAGNFAYMAENCYFDLGGRDVKLYETDRGFNFGGTQNCTIVTASLDNFNYIKKVIIDSNRANYRDKRMHPLPNIPGFPYDFSIPDHFKDWYEPRRGDNFLILTDTKSQELERWRY